MAFESNPPQGKTFYKTHLYWLCWKGKCSSSLGRIIFSTETFKACHSMNTQHKVISLQTWFLPISIHWLTSLDYDHFLNFELMNKEESEALILHWMLHGCSQVSPWCCNSPPISGIICRIKAFSFTGEDHISYYVLSSVVNSSGQHNGEVNFLVHQMSSQMNLLVLFCSVSL